MIGPFAQGAKALRVLGIETSCDETGVAVYDTDRGLVAHALHSQVAMHEAYGGVVPELASRDHVRRVVPLVAQVLREAGIGMADLDGIAYTQGPGLAGALLVGASVATAMAYALSIRTIPVHHLEGHLLSPLLSEPAPEFPFVALLVSGGHSQLFDVAGVGHYRLLGDTLDDAAGEAFDKTAKMLGLPYPGGPALAQLARDGTPGAVTLPRPMLASGDLDFSFSGLKTAVLTLARKEAHGARPDALADGAQGRHRARVRKRRRGRARREGAGGARADGPAAPGGGRRRRRQPAVARASCRAPRRPAGAKCSSRTWRSARTTAR